MISFEERNAQHGSECTHMGCIDFLIAVDLCTIKSAQSESDKSNLGSWARINTLFLLNAWCTTADDINLIIAQRIFWNAQGTATWARNKRMKRFERTYQGEWTDHSLRDNRLVLEILLLSTSKQNRWMQKISKCIGSCKKPSIRSNYGCFIV